MLVEIAECRVGGKVWRHHSRSKNVKVAKLKAIRRFFGPGCFFYPEKTEGGNYGCILKRAYKNPNAFDVVVDKVRMTIG